MSSQNQVFNQRIAFIDILKGIGIILMVMGHIYFGQKFDVYIHAFHMPLFFFISGYLFNTNASFRTFITKKARTLLIPYFSFGVLYLIFATINGANPLKFLEVFLFFNNKGIPIGGALWFLTALFFCLLIFYVIIYKIKYRFMIPIVIFSLVCIVYLNHLRLPFSINTAIMCLPIVYFGFLFQKIGKYVDLVFEYNRYLFTIILLILSGLMIFVNGYVNVRENEYGNLILFYIIALIAILAYWYLAKIISTIPYKKCLLTIQKIGFNSLIFMCLNQFVLQLLDMQAYSISRKLLLLVVTVIILNEFCKLINSNKLLSKIFKGVY